MLSLMHSILNILAAQNRLGVTRPGERSWDILLFPAGVTTRKSGYQSVSSKVLYHVMRRYSTLYAITRNIASSYHAKSCQITPQIGDNQNTDETS